MSPLCKHLVLRITAVVVAVIVAGCSGSRSGAPTRTEVVGKYLLSDESSRFLVRDKHYTAIPSSYIELRANGEALVKGMPDCYVIEPPVEHPSFLAGHGTWQLETTDFGWGVTLDIVPGGTLAPGIYDGSSILLKGSAPPYSLQVGIGDPDTNESILFARGS